MPKISFYLFIILTFSIALLGFAASAVSSNEQVKEEEVLTNETVIKMVKADLGETIIISKIKGSKTDFDLSTDGIIKLKEAGISEKVIEAMMGKKERPAEVKMQEVTTPPASSNEKELKKEEEKRERMRGGPFMAAIQPVEKTFPTGYNETWKAVVQAFAAIGESVQVADKDSGVISTSMSEMKGGFGYGVGKHSRHSLNVVVNKVTDEKTKVSIKRKVMVMRSFFVGASTTEDPSDGSVEENLIRNIVSILNVQPLEGPEIEKIAWKRGDPFPNKK